MTTRGIQSLTSAMNWAAERQKIINHNIANADTPHYQRRELDFAQTLTDKADRLALTRTHSRHLAGSTQQSKFGTGEWGVVRVDQNGVDLEVEMVKSTENVLYFQSLTQELNNQIRRLRMAIQGRS